MLDFSISIRAAMLDISDDVVEKMLHEVSVADWYTQHHRAFVKRAARNSFKSPVRVGCPRSNQFALGHV